MGQVSGRESRSKAERHRCVELKFRRWLQRDCGVQRLHDRHKSGQPLAPASFLVKYCRFSYLRTLLIYGARSVIRYAENKAGESNWLCKMWASMYPCLLVRWADRSTLATVCFVGVH